MDSKLNFDTNEVIDISLNNNANEKHLQISNNLISILWHKIWLILLGMRRSCINTKTTEHF